MEAALKPFGWTCGQDFWQRYYTDPWVFNLANAVERLTALLSGTPTPTPESKHRVEHLMGYENTNDTHTIINAPTPAVCPICDNTGYLDVLDDERVPCPNDAWHNPVAPSVCPTCGSDNPAKCALDSDINGVEEPPHAWDSAYACCDDAFHLGTPKETTE
jgi:hypothetical protein